MKIVFLAPFGIRPKGTLIARMLPLAAELNALGHQVIIIAPPYTNPEDSGKVEIVRGVVIRNIMLGPRNKILSVLILAGRMLRATRDESPDIIHLFKPKGYGGVAAMLLLALHGVGKKIPPLLVDTDDWEGKGGMNELHSYSIPERIFYQFQEKWLLSRAAAVTVASRMLQTLVEGIVECGTQILYLPNCITDIPAGNGDEVRGALGIAVGTPVVLLYSRFFEFSQDKLYSVCSGILRQVPEVRFLVVGRGRHNEELLLKEYCLAHGFGENLVMAGWLDPVEIPAYLAAADVAIYPFNDTMINRCKCPAKLTEIMRAGVPVVADCVGQLAEYIRPGLSGMLCEPDKWEEMVEQTVHLLKQRNEGQQLGIAGRNYLLDTFSWNIYAASLNELYCCLIRDNSKDV